MAQPGDNPLGRYVWQNRVLVVFAGDEASEARAQQKQVLDQEQAGLRERDLVRVMVGSDGVEVDGVGSASLEADGLRRALDVPAQGFRVVLIGKDGGVKLRSDEPVGAPQLFALIDAMPMRRQEMRSRSWAS